MLKFTPATKKRGLRGTHYALLRAPLSKAVDELKMNQRIALFIGLLVSFGTVAHQDTTIM